MKFVKKYLYFSDGALWGDVSVVEPVPYKLRGRLFRDKSEFPGEKILQIAGAQKVFYWNIPDILFYFKKTGEENHG